MRYVTADGRRVLDGTSGLWCVNAGHCRPKIVEAIRRQAGGARLCRHVPDGAPEGVRVRLAPRQHRAAGIRAVCSSPTRGRSSVDTALKIAIAYHRAKGNGSKTRLIGRERGYHGVNFGGTAVGGIGANRKHVRRAGERRRSPAPHARSCAQRLQPRASRSTAPSSPTIWSASWRCTMPRLSRPSSSSRSPARPACWCRRKGYLQAARRDLRQARHPAHLR